MLLPIEPYPRRGNRFSWPLGIFVPASLVRPAPSFSWSHVGRKVPGRIVRDGPTLAREGSAGVCGVVDDQRAHNVPTNFVATHFHAHVQTRSRIGARVSAQTYDGHTHTLTMKHYPSFLTPDQSRSRARFPTLRASCWCLQFSIASLVKQSSTRDSQDTLFNYFSALSEFPSPTRGGHGHNTTGTPRQLTSARSEQFANQ